MKLVLASASPRRRELLASLGLVFQVAPAELDETAREGEAAEAYVVRLAREKALAISARFPGDLALAADTAVVLDEQILGKPGDDAQLGAAMLRQLAGRTHRVMTGIAVGGGGALRSQVVTTQVSFRPLTGLEIAWYVATGEGRDKAGGYAVQGRAGAFITSLEGSPSNVVGLPLAESLELLGEAGYPLPWSGAR